MLQNHDISATTDGGATLPAAKICGNCGGDAQNILHNIRHRSIFRRICTSCVLRLHPQSFCPTCFSVYHHSSQPPLGNGVVTCSNCYSSSHSTCVGPNPQSSYVCPLCVNPTPPIFVLKKANEVGLGGSVCGVNGRVGYEGEGWVIDKRGAKVLVAAAMISSLSMSDAELVARSVAERRAKEAASTRKRATQALDYMAALAAREKIKKSESLPGSGMGAGVSRFPGSGGSGLMETRDGYGYSRGGNGRSEAVVGLKIEETRDGYGYSRGGNGRSEAVIGVKIEEKEAVVGVKIEEKEAAVGVVVDRSSNVVLTRAVDGVELRNNERLGGLGPQGSGFSELTFSDGVAIDADERRVMSSGSGMEVGDSAVQEHDGGVLNEISGNPQMQGVESTDPGQNENGMHQ